MANNEKRLDLEKKVYTKEDYIKTIDVEFSEFGTTTVAQDLESQPTVQDFFNLYNELFYEINPLGDTNSHAYLVETSAEYINQDVVNEEIEALRAEITSLREQLLEAQIANVTKEIEATGDEASIKQLENLQSQLKSTSEEIVETAEENQAAIASIDTGGDSGGTTVAPGGGASY
tara:strand:- start:77 stop:601 length:525 start_codon:yes stop_codon:yes gene_type:complete